MRFVPHRNPDFQTSVDPIDPDYDSTSDYSDDDNDESYHEQQNHHQILTTITDSSLLINDLTQVLQKTGLQDKHNYNITLVNLQPNVDPLRPTRTRLKINKVVEIVDVPSARKIRVEEPEQERYVSLVQDKLTQKLKQNRLNVQRLIALEEERKRREEEERLRKIREEEEKIRKLEAEKERQRLEAIKKLEEGRKRQEEEAKRLAEEQKKMSEAKKKAMEEAEAKAKQEEEEKAKIKATQDAKAKEEAAKQKAGTTNFLDIEKSFLKYKQDVLDIETTIVQPLKTPEQKELKKMVGAHKRKINPKFGQLTKSQQQLTRITKELNGLITETKSNEFIYKWILNFVAEAVVSQAETEAGVKPELSIALSKLTLNLLIIFPELEYFLMARFVEKCPLLIGYSCAIDTEEGRLRMGYKRRDNRWEEDGQYCERLSGIFTVYSVITRLKLDTSYLGYNQQKHPLPISKSWILVSRLLNLPLDLTENVHFIVAGAWWDACAFEFQQAYGKQAEKLLLLMCIDWTQAVADRRYSGAARLRLIGEEWLNTRRLKSFKKLEP